MEVRNSIREPVWLRLLSVEASIIMAVFLEEVESWDEGPMLLVLKFYPIGLPNNCISWK